MSLKPLHTRETVINAPLKLRSRLHLISNSEWQAHADAAKYSASALAVRCGASPRHLRRFFLQHMGKSPRVWLNQLRMRNAIRLFTDGYNVSETSQRLHYEQPSHFSREFKRFYGFCPKVAARLHLRGEQMAA